MGGSWELSSPFLSADLIASIPSYWKHVTSISALTFTGWGVNLLLILFNKICFNSSLKFNPSNAKSGSLSFVIIFLKKKKIL